MVRKPLVVKLLIFIGALIGFNTLYCPFQPLDDRRVAKKLYEWVGRNNCFKSFDEFLDKGFKVIRKYGGYFPFGDGRNVEVYYAQRQPNACEKEDVKFAVLTMTACGRISNTLKMTEGQLRFNENGEIVLKKEVRE